MNLKILLVVSGLVGFTWISFFRPSADFDQKESVILQAIKTYLEQGHFDPEAYTDEFSSTIFDNYIKNLDAGKRIFLQEDIDMLSENRLHIDDEIKSNSFFFFDQSIEVFEQKLKRTENLFQELINSDFDFSEKVYFETDAEKRDYAKNLDELKARWHKIIKYDIVNRVVNQKKKKQNKEEQLAKIDEFYTSEDGSIDTAKLHKDQKFVQLPIDSFIERGRKRTKENFSKWFDRMEDQRRVDWLSVYLNSIVSCLDPHTQYFKPKDKEDFDMRMSNRLEGIGARLTKDAEYVKIAGIVPGGPAWKGKELQEDDLILKVAQENEEAVDIMGMHIDDVVSMIRGKKGSTVTLTVKHIDGEIENIDIVRDVIVFEENYAKSALIVDSTSGEKFGYIDLPSFYADFNDPEAPSSSSDMRKELKKIKAQNLNGVIIDLRNNGGGSLRDVVDIAGQFIKDGPIVQVKNRDGRARVYKDKDPEVVFDGAVVLLVNHFSASASEILAAALQDYDRAIVIGANSTFGKGSVQRFFNLDRAIRGNSNIKPLGSIKMTTQKYYRVDGGSVQLRGVSPDIIVPDRYNYVDIGEKDYPFAMEWSKIEPLEYDQEVYKIENKAYFEQKSRTRIAQNETFQLIEASAKQLEKLQNESMIELTIEGIEAYKKERDELNKKLKEVKGDIEGLEAMLLDEDVAFVRADSARIDRYNAFMDGLDEDVYIAEAMAVLNDLVESQAIANKEE